MTITLCGKRLTGTLYGKCYDYIQDLESRNLSQIIWMGPKCNHKRGSFKKEEKETMGPQRQKLE